VIPFLQILGFLERVLQELTVKWYTCHFDGNFSGSSRPLPVFKIKYLFISDLSHSVGNALAQTYLRGELVLYFYSLGHWLTHVTGTVPV
jgi:hypothetical protein